MRIGVLAALYANTHRDPAKRSQPFSPLEFTVGGEQKSQQSPEEQKAIMQQWIAAMGARRG